MTKIVAAVEGTSVIEVKMVYMHLFAVLRLVREQHDILPKLYIYP